ncbi:alpha/beta hydrolase [Saccharopolyspora gloriosae]|uniref:alpha/beta hydrolase family protein n=1 Tax=Saccharopolyspora gloriosae TaxID=455344 RepID=UPI001FB6D4E2|nr:alpha/beta hydrolase [Saccharopolyspora gloriosae]
MGKSARVTGAVMGAALLTLTVAPTAAAEAPRSDPPVLALPAPTGPAPVGSGTVHLRDESRQDPWVPAVERELMVTLWYPATEPAGEPTRYVTPEESRLYLELQAEHGGRPIEPAEILSTVRTHAKVGAPALRTPDGHPLVVLSPGFSWPRATLSGLGEELASRGYVVALIGHNHESAGTAFPDGRVTECVACEVQDMPRVVRTRSDDVRFVLDELVGDPRFGELIDERRIGMVGHSVGGASASAAMVADSRIDAGVNLDGTFFEPLSSEIRRPFLMFGAGVHGPGGVDGSWDATWEHLSGWKRWITLNGSGHGSATDLSMLVDQYGIRYPGEPLPGARGAELGNRYVTAFLDQHLRGQARPILDGPTEENPEALFWHHE